MRALVAALADDRNGAAMGTARRLPEAQSVAALAGEAMRETKARGLAVAVIEDGKVASVQAFGERNAKGEPLTVDTVMYGASLTKAVFAYTVMQLVEEGKVDLDRPIAAYLPSRCPNMATSTPTAIGATLPATSAGARSRRASC